jgi:hypothetical protein
MQTLGLSESTPRTESRWKALLWPSIRNDADLDYVTEQGFWVCLLVAVLTLVFSVFSGAWASGVFECAFFFLGGVGVRQRSRVAAVAAFSAYLLTALVLQRYTGNGFGVVRVMFCALLLANVRGTWSAAHWTTDAAPDSVPAVLNQTLGDKLSDQLPTVLWPRVRYVFYVLAAAENALLMLALFMPRMPV